MKRTILVAIFFSLLLISCGRAETPLPQTAAAKTATPTASVAVEPSPTATKPKTPTPTKENTPTPTPTLSKEEITKIFEGNPEFLQELFKQDKNVSKNLVYEDGHLYLITPDGKQYEVDKDTATINKDINGQALLVEDSAFPNPITIHGTGESEGKVFAYAPLARVHIDDNPSHDKVIAAHWFEVIQPNHPVDANATGEKLKSQLEIAINDPVKVTIDQVQSGELSMSVLLSGLGTPFPKDWQFTGNAINRDKDTILLYTSDEIPKNFFAVVVDEKGEVISGVVPFQVGNSKDPTKPGRNEVMFFNRGIVLQRKVRS